MNKNLIVIAILSVAALAGCGSKTDANEKNFGAALSQYFDKKGGLCLGLTNWPVDVSEEKPLFSITLYSIEDQMAALEAAGLVKSENTERDAKGFGVPKGKKVKIKRYTLTDAALPFVQEVQTPSWRRTGSAAEKESDLCWGKKVLKKVVKWEGPIKFGDYQEAAITYTYKVDKVADWAKRPDIQAAFPPVKDILAGVDVKESTHGVKLTSEGWEAKGLN